MKERYMAQNERISLRKRAIIETTYDELKNICQISHTAQIMGELLFKYNRRTDSIYFSAKEALH